MQHINVESDKKIKIDVRTPNTYSLYQNKADIVIIITIGTEERLRIQIRIPNRVWYFGMVWEADIYLLTVGKDGIQDLEGLTVDTIDISEWLESEFYDLVCF